MAKLPKHNHHEQQINSVKSAYDFSVSEEDRSVVDRTHRIKPPKFPNTTRSNPTHLSKSWFGFHPKNEKLTKDTRQTESELSPVEFDDEDENYELPTRKKSKLAKLSQREIKEIEKQDAKLAKEDLRLAKLEAQYTLKQRKAALKSKQNAIVKKQSHRKKRSFFGNILYFGVVLGIWGIIISSMLLAYHASQLPPLSRLALPSRLPNISIIGTTGEVLVARGARGESISLLDMPKTLPQAVIAIEDNRFYNHYGIDPIGLLRAVLTNVKSGTIVQGGSTLTQQLAKNLFLSSERSIGRKIQELLLAFWLEQKFTKDVILELYLNRVYLGAGAYGVEAASQRYFGKSARFLNLKESAIIAGLLKAPSYYAPTRNPEAANERAELVLSRMQNLGFITISQMKSADRDNVKVAASDEIGSAVNYAADWVMDQLPGFIGNVSEDIVVETTLDPFLQRHAETVLRSTLEKEGEKLKVSQGALISVDGIGAVRALIGGRSYTESAFNRAVTAKRQPGSSFKTFVFLAAMENGLRPDTLREDSPVNIKGWTPENYTRNYRGFVPLSEALALSLNTVAVRLGLEIGPKNVISTAQRLGIKSTLRPDASIALGTSEVSLMELTSSYVPFANGGFTVHPYIIKSIYTAKGEVRYERKNNISLRTVQLSHVGMMNAMLSEVVVYGTAKKAAFEGWPIAGKTGTSQDFRDAYFIGYTSNLTTGVWLGNDNNSPTKKVTGGGLPAQIWAKFMREAHKGLQSTALPGLENNSLFAVNRQNDPANYVEATASFGQNPNNPIDLDEVPAQQFGTPPQRNDGKNCQLGQDFLKCVFGKR